MTKIDRLSPSSNVARYALRRCASLAGWLCATCVVAFLLSCAVSARNVRDEALPANPVTAGAAEFTVAGEIARPQTFDIAALAKMPRASIRAKAHDVEGEWEGVPLIEILRAAGAPVDDALRGKNLSLYVRISAADGYQAVYALAELDPKFRDGGVLLVDHRDGKLLGADQGPFRIVAPLEKRPGRWVRQVIRIDVLRAPD